MARIRGGHNQDKIVSMNRWLGVNENPDGDINLKFGEASAMTNFKITSGGSLQKRPGTQNVANLLFDYDVAVATESTTVLTETLASTATFTVYPGYNLTDGGLLYLSGTPATVSSVNIAAHAGDYWQDSYGVVWQLGTCDYNAGSGDTAYRWNKWSVDSSYSPPYYVEGPAVLAQAWEALYPGAAWVAGTGYSFNPWTGQYAQVGAKDMGWGFGNQTGYVSGGNSLYIQVISGGGYTVYTSAAQGPYGGGTVYAKGSVAYGYVYGADSAYPANDKVYDSAAGTYYWYDGKVQNTSYTWRFYRVSIVPNTADNEVRGIWSGRVAFEEVICAACNGYLWVLSETNGVWYKSKLGPVETHQKVHMFGFDSKLYILNGSEYLVWSAEGKDITYTATIQAASGTDRQFGMLADGVYYLFVLDAWATGDTLIYRPLTNVLTHNNTPVAFTTTTHIFQDGGLIRTTAVYGVSYTPPAAVAGYRPLVAKEVLPTGGGTPLQRVNMLCGQRRIQCSPTGSAVTFTLPEKNLASIDYVRYAATGDSLSIASASLSAGTVTLTSAPAAGTDTIEIGYTAATALRGTVEAMKCAELYNGGTDNRLFLYGDGTNKAIYSDLDDSGRPRADYFPDLNVVHVGASNTPLTGMVRHYDRLLAFKEDSAYSIAYDALTLADGSVTAGFYVTTINKGIGSAGLGQAVLVENHPRTLDGRSIYEWVATTTSGNITSDQRNAQRVSQNVWSTLREIDETKAIAFYDKINYEYYVVENGIAIIQNTENGAWYIYRDFPAVCMIVYRDELYYGTADGFLRHVSRTYRHDCGAPIQCYWESGSMDFGMAWRKKSSDLIWIVLQPEDDAAVTVTVQTDKQSDFQDLDFAHFSFNVNNKPQTQRRRLRVRSFTWYKLIFSSVSRDTTVTLLNADIKVRPTSMVR